MTSNNEKILSLLNRIRNRDSLVNIHGLSDEGKFDGFEHSIYSILYHMDSVLEANDRLKDEIQKLKAENFKDNEIQQAKKELKEMEADYNRGFPISEEEEKKIENWKLDHMLNKHPHEFKDPSAFGAIGGNFSYTFTPTSIGVIGYVQCSCGEQFEFTNGCSF